MSLFTDRPQARQGPSSFAASMLVHGGMVGVLCYGMLHAPLITDPALSMRFDVRHVEFHQREQQASQSGGSGIAQAIAKALQPASRPAERRPASWRIPQLAPAKQTLVQPDLPRNLALSQETPIPTVVIWTPKRAQVKLIVPPLPQKAASADVEPSLDAPNEELTLADASVAASESVVPLPQLAPSTTSPVRIERPDSVEMAPVISSESTEQPTAATALSLSDLRMPQGTVILPPANETAPAASLTTTAPGLSEDSAQQGDDDHASESDVAKTVVSASGAAAENGAALGLEAASGNGSGKGDQPTGDHITLPKNGRFGVVVVGSSVDEEYPDLMQIWGGRVAYTVYLQVGRRKNWILQYSLLRSANVATEGGDAPLEAPWPYDIVAPHLIPALLNADAIVVHGRVNSAGRFESLAIVYPAHVPQGTLVLNSLAHWQFRPAKKDGNATTVEVVLVIPNEAN
jgi:hypothetical protein